MRIFVNGTLKEIACPVRKNTNRDKEDDSHPERSEGSQRFFATAQNDCGQLSNGVKKPRKLATAGGLTVKTLLDTLKLNSGTIAVELNLEVVPKKEYDTKYLKEDDKIEIISFVGGG